MEGVVKIGRTANSAEQRIRELDNTSLPLPFQCFYAAEVVNSALVEGELHRIFSDKRIRSNREFFRVDANQRSGIQSKCFVMAYELCLDSGKPSLRRMLVLHDA